MQTHTRRAYGPKLGQHHFWYKKVDFDTSDPVLWHKNAVCGGAMFANLRLICCDHIHSNKQTHTHTDIQSALTALPKLASSVQHSYLWNLVWHSVEYTPASYISNLVTVSQMVSALHGGPKTFLVTWAHFLGGVWATTKKTSSPSSGYSATLETMTTSALRHTVYHAPKDYTDDWSHR